jgi:hypothetical protein
MKERVRMHADLDVFVVGLHRQHLTRVKRQTLDFILRTYIGTDNESRAEGNAISVYTTIKTTDSPSVVMKRMSAAMREILTPAQLTGVEIRLRPATFNTTFTME